MNKLRLFGHFYKDKVRRYPSQGNRTGLTLPRAHKITKVTLTDSNVCFIQEQLSRTAALPFSQYG